MDLYAVKCQKLANDQQKAEGKAALELIEAVPTPSPEGKGRLLNVVA